MSKNIVEENPNAPQPSGGAADKVRKQARQLAYDVRYKVKQGFKEGQKADPASLKRAYMSQLGKSPAPGPVRQLAKKMLIGESYDFIDIAETASNAVADAVKKVFVKTTKLDDAEGNPAYEVVDFMQESGGEKKYKIRVTDKKTGKSYTRYADRDKISELRKNPNISSVEMTGYGTPYEGEKKKGEQTAAVKSGKDFDGDGKKESSSKEHAGVVHNAIQRKKGGIPDGKDTRKEEFIGEVKDVESDNPDANSKKVDVMKGKNKITINPTQTEAVDSPVGDKKPDAGIDAKQKRVAIMKRQILQKKMQAVRGGAGADIVAHNELEGEIISEKEKKKGLDGKECWDGYKLAGTKKKGGKTVDDCVKVKEDAQYGYDKDGKSLNPKDKEKDSEKKLPQNSVVFDGGASIEPVGDEREIPTIVNLMKTKLRARGLNMSHVPEGEQLDELNKAERVDAGQGKRAAKKGDWSKQKAKTGKRNINRFETKPVEREHGTLDKGKQSFKKVKVLNPKSGYSKKTDATKGKVTSRKLSQTGTDSKPDYGPQKPHWAGNVHSDRAQEQRRSEHKARRGVKTKGTVASDIKKSMKETLDPSVQSAVDSLNSYYSKNEGYQRDPEQQGKERKRSKQTDPSKAGFTGISDDIGEIMRQNAAMKKAAAAKKVKEEYDNTKSPDYAKKKKALAKKHGGADKVKGHPQYESIVQSAVDALDRFSLKKD